jgi:EpsI family protein
MRTFLAAAAILAATAGYVVMTPPDRLPDGHGILRNVPHEFGPWRGADAKFEQAVVDELQADDVLIRRYADGDRSVWLCLVYHQNRRYGSHDPLLCYTSQGFEIEQAGRATVDDGSPSGLVVNTCVAGRGADSRVVWYWWTTRGLSTGDAGSFRSRVALLGALDNRSWGAFVRVESVLSDDGVPGASARVREFAGRVAHELPAIFAKAEQAPPTAP